MEFPAGLVRVVSDNEQVIGKCYWVRTNQESVLARVICNSIYLQIDSENFS